MASCIPPELAKAAESVSPPNDNLGAVASKGASNSAVASEGGDNVVKQPSTLTDNEDRPTSSVFARGDEAPVHVVPMRVIHRPLPSELDEHKVLTFMEEMKAGDVFTPIEVVKVHAPLKNDPTRTPHNFYFAMGGCHRYEATKRLGLETIRAKIIEVPASNMRVYMGAGCPF